MVHKTDSEEVREFTSGAGKPTPNTPSAMSKEEVHFLSKMMLDEIMEFMATVSDTDESKTTLKKFIDDSRDLPLEKYDEGDEASLIADQADALIDSYYYSLDTAAKKGINLSSLFKIVHGANMAKKCPVQGKFLKREDGKIIKPEGWKGPDVRGEIVRQMKEGSF